MTARYRRTARLSVDYRLRRWDRAERWRLVRRVVLAAFLVAAMMGFVLYLGGRFFISFNCLQLYGMAKTPADSAMVDSTIVVRSGLAHPITCADERRDNVPPYDKTR